MRRFDDYLKTIIYVLFFLLIGMIGYKAKANDDEIRDLRNKYQDVPVLRQALIDQDKQLAKIQDTVDKIMRELKN